MSPFKILKLLYSVSWRHGYSYYHKFKENILLSLNKMMPTILSGRLGATPLILPLWAKATKEDGSCKLDGVEEEKTLNRVSVLTCNVVKKIDITEDTLSPKRICA